VIHRLFLPGFVVVYRNVDDDADAEGLPQRVRECKLIGGKAAAYIWDEAPEACFTGTDPQAFKTALLRA